MRWPGLYRDATYPRRACSGVRQSRRSFKLPQQVREVDQHPMLNNLVVRDSVRDENRYRHFPSGWRDIHQSTVMDSAYLTADRDLVAFGDHVLSLQPVTREGRLIHRDVLLEVVF